MASTLWKVEVFKLAGDTVRLAVTLLHPDAGPFQTEKAFAIRMLFEQATEMNDDFERVARGPLGTAIDVEQVHDDAYLAAHVGDFISKVEVSNVQNEGLDRDKARAAVDKALAAEGKKKSDPGYAELQEERLESFWADAKNLPTAVYTIQVTDGKWLQHLKPGQTWGSAAY